VCVCVRACVRVDVPEVGGLEAGDSLVSTDAGDREPVRHSADDDHVRLGPDQVAAVMRQTDERHRRLQLGRRLDARPEPTHHLPAGNVEHLHTDHTHAHTHTHPFNGPL